MPISDESRRHLESFFVTEEEFVKLVMDRDLPDGRFIALLENKVVFDECTNPPHGEVIGEVIEQISLQDKAAGRLLISGTGNRITLF